MRRDWPSAGASGTIVIVHGLGEHIGRYAHVAARLTRAGWSVVGYDQRGHGRSAGRARPARRRRRPARRPGARSSTPCAPSSRRPAGAARPQPRRPGRRALRRRRARVAAAGLVSATVDALVLSSPALAIGMTAAQARLLATLGPLTPNLGIGNGLEADWHLARRRRSSPRTAPIRWSTTGSRRGWSASSSTAGRRVLALAPRWQRADAAALRRQRPLRRAGRQRRVRRGGAGGGRDGARLSVALPRDLQRARAGRGVAAC